MMTSASICSGESLIGGRVRLFHGDARAVLAAMADASIDSVVTDPPYALVSIGKRFGRAGAKPARAREGGSGVYARASAGFMGETWDTGETAFDPDFWGEVLRVLKPGGHVLAFGGTRTYHWLAVAIERAGFEIRDQLGWVYASGFPKSHDAGNGWGTALKPAWEPIVLARKPLVGTVAETVRKHGTGALNIDGCRIAVTQGDEPVSWGGKVEIGFGGRFDGVKDQFCGKSSKGRWPANVVHDDSAEVKALLPQTKSGLLKAGTERTAGNLVYGEGMAPAGRSATERDTIGDAGSAARFFYSAKADAEDRAGSKHPTVKPVDLMRWLCRLVTPPGGVVLDPFAGSGTTGEAAWREGFAAVLVEREERFCADIRRRMDLALAGPATRKAASVRRRPADGDHGPLFGGGE